MATVRKTVLKNFKQECALTFVRNNGNQELAAMSFTRELKALADLDHRNIVRLIGVGTDGLDRSTTLEWLEEVGLTPTSPCDARRDQTPVIDPLFPHRR